MRFRRRQTICIHVMIMMYKKLTSERAGSGIVNTMTRNANGTTSGKRRRRIPREITNFLKSEDTTRTMRVFIIGFFAMKQRMFRQIFGSQSESSPSVTQKRR